MSQLAAPPGFDGFNLQDVATYGYRGERWNFVEGEALAGIVQKLNKEQNRYAINPATTRLVWRTLPFYMGATLVRTTDMSWRPFGITSFFIGVRGQYRRMDGSKKLIEHINERMPLKLTAQNVAEYLRFYCFFVRAHGRPFIIVEAIEDIGLCEPPLNEAQIARITPELHPITLVADKGPEGFSLSATIRYNDMLFSCIFNITQRGQVSMVEDHVQGVYVPIGPAHSVAAAWSD